MKIFISHSSKDKWAARRISKDLTDMGFQTFLDEKDIKSGEPIDEAIRGHLKDCDDLLILLSPASLNSHWVLIEVGGAMALGKRIVPVLLYLGANEIPSPISKHLARDINEIDKYYNELKHGTASAKATKDKVKPIKPKQIKPIKTTYKVGDLIMLPLKRQKPAMREKDININWDSEMDDYIGKEANIIEVDNNDNSVRVDIDNGEWWWAFEWIEKVYKS